MQKKKDWKTKKNRKIDALSSRTELEVLVEIKKVSIWFSLFNGFLRVDVTGLSGFDGWFFQCIYAWDAQRYNINSKLDLASYCSWFISNDFVVLRIFEFQPCQSSASRHNHLGFYCERGCSCELNYYKLWIRVIIISTFYLS
jgi:hypothetical protein